MRPAPAHAVALLLLVAAVAMPAVAVGAADSGPSEVDRGPVPAVTTVPNYVNYLSIPDDQVATSAFGTASLDAGAAIATDHSRLRTRFRTVQFEQSFANASTSTERVDIARAFVDDATVRSQDLQERRHDIVRGYANGSLSTSRFLRSLALVSAQARDLRLAVSQVQDRLNSPPETLATRLDNLEGELEVLSGPLGRQIVQASYRSGAARTVYVEASETGYTLAMIDGGTYVRETYLATERNANGTDLFAQADLRVNAANRRGAELYPWVTNNTSPAGQALGTTGMYRFRVDHNSGELIAYLDGNTTDVFREHQRQSLATIPVSDTIVATNGTLAVVVNRTYDTGPMNVSVTRTTSGEPVAGTVFINGNRVGSTGADGSLWTIEPRSGVPLTVRTEEGGVVQVRVPA